MYHPPIDADEGDLETGTRVCIKCSNRKPMGSFYRAGKYRRRACKDCVRVVREPSEATRAWGYKYNLKTKYGLTVEQFEAMVTERNGQCDICDQVMVPPHVDHNHATGVVRGLLCFTCNTALGKFKDSEELLLRAVAYLRRSDDYTEGTTGAPAA